MHSIFNLILSFRRFFSLLVTVILSLIMITSPPMKQAATLRFLSMTAFFPLQVALSQTTKIRNIFGENRHLRAEVVRLSAEVAELQEKAQENKRLRDMLDLADNFDYSLLPVRVIAQDPSPAQRSIVVTAGVSDSAAMWMPLVNERGVVGKVVQVMHRISLVQLLKDPSNRTGVLFRRTRATGILETENGNDFFVQCRSHEPIEEGDTIVTSGLGGIYPRGLNVGTVKKIAPDPDPLFKQVEVAMSVDFNHIEELFIMRLSPQWSAFRTELDSIEFDND
ncbi:MAG: rod shape-determining protein MreC [Chitinispirillaceae bacterium]|nr:rod shape-determining protein MreC [Chitinispirillaceae bacterium]